TGGANDVRPDSADGGATAGLGANDVPHIEQYRRWLAFSAPQRGHIFLELDIADVSSVASAPRTQRKSTRSADRSQSTRRPSEEGRAFGGVYGPKRRNVRLRLGSEPYRPAALPPFT